MANWLTIESEKLVAAINPLGAELSSLRDAQGRELMTDADPAFWTGRAPILFPIVGRAHDDVIRVGGQAYPMPKHGFARTATFDVVAHEPHRLVMRLADTAETRSHYPYAFVLDMEFALEGATLAMTAHLTNPAATPLLASFGYHPAFAWPLPYGTPRADHRITFANDEPGELREISPDGLIAPEMRATPVEGRIIRLADALFENDALVWSPVANQALTYGASSGPHLAVTFPDATNLGIWTKPGGAYVCIEPWNGIADPAGFNGEFADKPGVETLAPGETRQYRMNVSLKA